VTPTLEQYDDEEIRCLQLGGPVTFNYCRRVNAGLPCRLLPGCWQGRLDIVGFLTRHFSAEQLQDAFQPPPGSKLERLIALVSRSKAGSEPPTGEEDQRQEPE